MFFISFFTNNLRNISEHAKEIIGSLSQYMRQKMTNCRSKGRQLRKRSFRKKSLLFWYPGSRNWTPLTELRPHQDPKVRTSIKNIDFFSLDFCMFQGVWGSPRNSWNQTSRYQPIFYQLDFSKHQKLKLVSSDKFPSTGIDLQCRQFCPLPPERTYGFWLRYWQCNNQQCQGFISRLPEGSLPLRSGRLSDLPDLAFGMLLREANRLRSISSVLCP